MDVTSDRGCAETVSSSNHDDGSHGSEARQEIVPAPLNIVDDTKKPFKMRYLVQLTPDYPGDDVLAGGAEIYVQKSIYNGEWLRVLPQFFAQHQGKEVPPRNAALLAIVAERVQATAALSFYVTFPEMTVQGTLIEAICTDGFIFHHYHASTHEFVYYKWLSAEVPNMVPDYSTHIHGASTIVLSPDETKVLLVEEYGRWGTSGGALNMGETALEGACRELQEEVGLALDPSFAVQLVGVYNTAKARDMNIGDTHTVFIGKAKTMDAVPNPHEISDVRWEDVDDLLALFEGVRLDDVKGWLVYDKKPGAQAVAYDVGVIQGLRNYRTGKCFAHHAKVKRKTFTKHIFM